MCCFSNCLTQTGGNRNRETNREKICPEQANNRGDNRDKREQGAPSWATEASVEGMLSPHSDSISDAIFMELLLGGADVSAASALVAPVRLHSVRCNGWKP